MDVGIVVERKVPKATQTTLTLAVVKSSDELSAPARQIFCVKMMLARPVFSIVAVTLSSSLKRAGLRYWMSRLATTNTMPSSSQFVLLETPLARPFGTGAFHKTQVVGVVDHTTGVGVFVIDPHGQSELIQTGQGCYLQGCCRVIRAGRGHSARNVAMPAG